MGICQSKNENEQINITNPNPKSGLEATQLTNQNQEINYRSKSNIENGQLSDKANIIKELNIEGNIQLPVESIIKAMKAVCKITIISNTGTLNGTGFFMRGLDSKKYLVSNYHVLTQKGNIEIEIHNKKKMKLNFNNHNNRDIKYYPDPKDVVLYEIKETDVIYRDVEFLDYDLNYKRGYEIYIMM